MKIILKDEKLIKLSNQFFILIFDSFDFSPNILAPNNEEVDNPFNEESNNIELLKEINGATTNNILKENFKTIMKYKIINYFQEQIDSIKIDKVQFNTKEKLENEKLKREIDIYLGHESYSFFCFAHDILNNIQNPNSINVFNKNLKEIYCIVYSNIFLECFVKYIKEQETFVSVCRNEILKFLSNNSTKIKESYKLLIIKLLRSHYIKERTKFLDIENWVEKYHLNECFNNLKFIDQESNNTERLRDIKQIFYGNYDLKTIEEEIFANYNNNNFNNLNHLSFMYNIDIFVNQNLSCLRTEEGKNLLKNSQKIKNFLSYVKENSQYTPGLKDLINLFFNIEDYNSKMENIIKTISPESFEILLYAYRFAISSAISNQNSIYNKLFNIHCIDYINKAYIPGAELNSDLFVESFFYIEDFMEKLDKSAYGEGFYVCDCGEFYYQPSCGVPTSITYCVNCGKEVGGLNEKLVERKEGEKQIFRVYANEENKKRVESRSDLKHIYKNGWYDSKLLNEFREEIYEKFKMDYKGIKCFSYRLFIDEIIKVRQLNKISYRLLSFIIYSNIFFSFICGKITLEELVSNQIVPLEEKPYKGSLSIDLNQIYRLEIIQKRKTGIKNEKDILKILEVNWNLLEKALKNEGIENIQIFLNLIFSKINEKIYYSNEMDTIVKRKEFEDQITEIINDAVKNFKKYSEKYNQNLEQSIISSNYCLNFKIIESDKKIENIDNEFPYYYEMLSIPIPSENYLKENIQEKKKFRNNYPVLYYYLNSDKKNIEVIKKFDSFNSINKFVKYTIEHYSNEISRKKANDISIISEINIKKIPRKLFDDYLNVFNKNKLYLIGDRFGCKELKFEKRELNENDCLAFFLIDKGVQSYGMQIASIFQKFINNQNTFLRNIFDNILPENHKLNLLKNKIIKNPIDIQKANKCNLISLNIKTENYQSFNELLLLYSYKESFDKDNHLTFEKSNKIYYNFEQIEEELENLLLPEKKLFTDKIYPVIYQYEGFRGEENSSILPSFIASNPQKDLNDTQKKILYKFKLEQYSREIRKKILFSIQLIITFYLDKPYGETLIKDTLNDLPNYFVIPTITKDLLINNDFKVNEILSIFEYFELLCFEEFKNNLDLAYKKELTKEQIENINLYYIYENQNKSKNEINENHKQIKFKIPK